MMNVLKRRMAMGTAAPATARGEDGFSAIEFAIIAPFLVIGLLSMADIGLAVFQRMTMDHVLRAGVQSAMADQGPDKVRRTLEASATEHFTLGGGSPVAGKPPITLSVSRYCVCPETPTTQTACSTICPSKKPTLAFYSLGATGLYSGSFMPDIALNPVVEVQVR